MRYFFASLRRWHFITYRLFAGLVIAALGMEDLLSHRFRGGTWLRFWTWVILAVLAWEWINFFFEPELPKSGTEEQPHHGAILLGIGLGFLAAFMDRSWALPGMGILTCVFLVAAWRLQERRYFLASAGWLLAGFAVSFVPWSSEDKFYLMIVIGGLVITIKGIIELPVRYHRALTMQSAE